MIFGWKLENIDFGFDLVSHGKVRDTVDWETKIKPFRKKIEDRYGGLTFSAKLKEHRTKDFFQEWYRWDPRFFRDFTFQDICKIWWDASISSEFSELFCPNIGYDSEKYDYLNNDFKNTPWRVVHKIKNSMWRYGWYFSDDSNKYWNTMVKVLRCIRSFDIGLKNFQVRLDATTHYNKRGRSRFSGVRKKKANGQFIYPAEFEIESCYIDAPLAFHLFYKNKLCVTISFAITNVDGKPKLVIFQIQGTGGKGNRGLYKFGKLGWFEHCLAKMHEYFSNEMDVCLVGGRDAADRVLNSYGEENRQDFRSKFYDKVIKLYDQKLKHCRKSTFPEQNKCDNCYIYKVLSSPFIPKKYQTSPYNKFYVQETLKSSLYEYFSILSKEDRENRVKFSEWERKRALEKTGLFL